MSTGVITLNKIRPQLIKPNSCLKEIRPISSFLAVTHHTAHEIDAMSIQFSPKVENCLRLRPLAYANLILGTVSVAFQLTLLIGYKNDYSKHYQAGVWIGLLFLLTGFISLGALRQRTNRFNMFLLFLAVCSAVNGLALVVVASIAIHAWYWVTWYWLEVTVIRFLNAVLITCGINAVIVNTFLSVAAFRLIKSHHLQLP